MPTIAGCVAVSPQPAGRSARARGSGSWPEPDAQIPRGARRCPGPNPRSPSSSSTGWSLRPLPRYSSPEARRLRLVALVHMPLGEGTTDEAIGNGRRAVLSAAASVVATSAWARRVLAAPAHAGRTGPRRRARRRPRRARAGRQTPGRCSRSQRSRRAGPRCAPRPPCGAAGASLAVPLRRQPGSAADVRRTSAPPRRRRRDGPFRVRFSGPQAGAELAESYRGADLLVLPSRVETYGMVVTEALARGLPVVAADVGGVPEALGHGAEGIQPGLLVPPDDAAALGGALRAWLEDAGLRRRLRPCAGTARVACRLVDHDFDRRGRDRGDGADDRRADLSTSGSTFASLRTP